METLTMTTEQITDELLDQCDGPVSKHTVIYRGIEFAQRNDINDVDLAEAISNALDFIAQNGDLPSNEFNR